jgi:Maltogenic Amylase, C-terminal domain
VKELLHLRQRHAALRRGELIHLFCDDRVLAYLRGSAAGPEEAAEQLLVVLNNSDQPSTVEFNLRDTPIAKAGSVTTLMGTGEAELIDGPAIRVPLASRSLGIYQLH